MAQHNRSLCFGAGGFRSAILMVFAIYLLVYPAIGTAESWNFDDFDSNNLSSEYRALYPTCVENLKNLIAGIAPPASRELGYNAAAINMIFQIFANPTLQPDEVLPTFLSKLKEDFPEIIAKFSEKQKTLSQQAPKIYSGKISSSEVRFGWGENSLQTFVYCQFQKLNADPFLRSVGVGRTFRDPDGSSIERAIGLDVNDPFDFVQK